MSKFRQAANASAAYAGADMKANYKMADHVFEVDSACPAVHARCTDYRTQETAEFFVAVSPEDRALEQRQADAQRKLEGEPPMAFPPEELEFMAVHRKICERLPQYDTLMFHGSAIAVDGEAYLFAAVSGTGKSTHTRLWREQFGERAFMVNDDKPLLRIQEGTVTVFGTPWDGKHGLSRNAAVPLKALCLLERSKENRIARIGARECYPLFLQQVYRPFDPGAMAKTLTLLDELLEAVPLYRLGCNMEPEAARVAYEAMKG